MALSLGEATAIWVETRLLEAHSGSRAENCDFRRGAFGDRSLPLMVDSNAWEILGDRAVAVSQFSGQQAAIDLIDALKNAHDLAVNEGVRGRLAKICGAVCASCVEAWDASSTVFTPEQIETFASGTLICLPMARMPRLDESWDAATERLAEAAKRSPYFLDGTGGGDAFAAWLGMISAISASEPRLLRRSPSFGEHLQLIATVVACSDERSAVGYIEFPSKSEMESLASDLRIYAKGFRLVATLSSSDAVVEMCERAAEMSSERASTWDRRASEAEADETDDYDNDDEPKNTSEFDVAALFADL